MEGSCLSLRSLAAQFDFDLPTILISSLAKSAIHQPTSKPWSRQYMSIIFYHDEKQKRLAVESKKGEEEIVGPKIFTEIIPATDFYLAEDYHQKYYLQGISELKKDFRAIYPDTRNFVDYTAAARVNGYIVGYGSVETLRENIGDLGLSPEGNDKLLAIAASWGDKMTMGEARAISIAML